MDLLDTTDVDLTTSSPPSSPPSSYQSTASSVTALTEAELFSRSHNAAELSQASAQQLCQASEPQRSAGLRDQKADILVQCGSRLAPSAALSAHGAKAGLGVGAPSESSVEESLEVMPLTVDHRPGEPSEMGMPQP